MRIISLIKRTCYDPVLVGTLLTQLYKKFFHRLPLYREWNQLCAGEFRFGSYQLNNLPNQTALTEEYCNRALSHYFNFLGTGFVSVNANVERRKGEYDSIDWNVDCKSGFRFNSLKQSDKLIKETFPKGVDVKVPWELSRMQHLPMLAYSSLKKPELKETYYTEFKDEITDFINTNPVNYGINWACTMDVALRVSSWLIAADLFSQAGMEDLSFNTTLKYAIMKHGHFIIKHLEKNFTEDKSGNHYLSDLLGLICIGHYLKNRQTRKWYEFASAEYKREILKQYLPDGGTYEFSSAYHRLDSELSSLAVAFMTSDGYSLNEEQIDRLRNSLVLLRALKTLDNSIIQIGDNDNGHAVQLSVEPDNIGVKNELGVKSSVGMLMGLFNEDNTTPENWLVRGIMKGFYYEKKINQNDWISHRKTISVSGLEHKCTSEFQVRHQLRLEYIFPYFGLAVYSANDVKLFFRFPPAIKRGKTVHAHSDALHFEICDGNKHSFADQGSYLYSPNVEMRTLFRSEKAHNVPIHSIPQFYYQGCWSQNYNISECSVDWDATSIVCKIKMGAIEHVRSIRFNEGVIVVSDSSNEDFDFSPREFVYESFGYGSLRKRQNKNE